MYCVVAMFASLSSLLRKPPWRMLPHDFPPWKTVYHYFRQWRLLGIWERMNKALRIALRKSAGREEEPSAAIVDSQSVKTTETKGIRGYVRFAQQFTS